MSMSDLRASGCDPRGSLPAALASRERASGRKDGDRGAAGWRWFLRLRGLAFPEPVLGLWASAVDEAAFRRARRKERNGSGEKRETMGEAGTRRRRR